MSCLIVDADNSFCTFPPEKRWQGYRLDYGPLADLAAGEGQVVDKAIYVSRLYGTNEAFLNRMEDDGWLPVPPCPQTRTNCVLLSYANAGMLGLIALLRPVEEAALPSSIPAKFVGILRSVDKT